jgi:hypothetical protein
MVWRKSGRKFTLWKSKRGWVDNIKDERKALQWESVDWIRLTADRNNLEALVNTVMNLRVT